MKLVFENLRFSYPGKTVLRGVSGEIAPGKTIFLLGANGSGKSTLIRLLAGLRRPQSGEIRLDGRALETLSRRECARHFGVVRQCATPEFDYTAEEFVLFGRNAKMSPFSGASAADIRTAERALEKTGLLAQRSAAARTLSGGEFQRLCLGAALALEGDFLLLDEPVSAQDAVHAERIMKLLREESETRGVLIVSHDLALAARFADEVWLLADGAIFAAGTPENTLDAGTVGRLYGCRAETAPGTPQYRFP